MDTSPKFVEAAFKDLMAQLRAIKDNVDRIDRKLEAMDYNLSQIKSGSH